MKPTNPITPEQAITALEIMAPETVDTFKTILRNRYCNGVRYWSMVDIAKERKMQFDSAETRYYNHWRKILQLFS